MAAATAAPLVRSEHQCKRRAAVCDWQTSLLMALCKMRMPALWIEHRTFGLQDQCSTTEPYGRDVICTGFIARLKALAVSVLAYRFPACRCRTCRRTQGFAQSTTRAADACRGVSQARLQAKALGVSRLVRMSAAAARHHASRIQRLSYCRAIVYCHLTSDHVAFRMSAGQDGSQPVIRLSAAATNGSQNLQSATSYYIFHVICKDQGKPQRLSRKGHAARHASPSQQKH